MSSRKQLMLWQSAIILPLVMTSIVCSFALPTHANDQAALNESYQRNPDSEATTEVEMKPYVQQLRDTEVKFKMIPIKGGEFIMGSPKDEEGRKEDEGPQHKVKIAPFWMGQCEVTWNEYDTYRLNLDIQHRKTIGREADPIDKIADAVARPTRAYTDMTFGMGYDGYPAICMTQVAAKMYCQWLSERTGHYYRLPTEAEWEYAARADSTTAYSFGDDPAELEEYAWFEDNSDYTLQKVGQKKPNAWGLHDMHGNVAEWVLDGYDPGFYKHFTGEEAAVFPLRLPTGEYPRVVRGGSWMDNAPMLRSAARIGSDPDWKIQDPNAPQSIWYLTDGDFVGFRVVRPLTPPTPQEIIEHVLYPDIPPELVK